MLPRPLDLVTPKNHRVGRPWRVAPNTTATGPLLFGIKCPASKGLSSALQIEIFSSVAVLSQPAVHDSAINHY
jgi:hypothetical protein